MAISQAAGFTAAPGPGPSSSNSQPPDDDVLAKLDERSLSKLVRDYKSGMLPIRLTINLGCFLYD
jgi:hypothetical protein